MAQAFEEGLEVIGHHLIQGLGLGRAAAVGDGGHTAPVCNESNGRTYANIINAMKAPAEQQITIWDDEGGL